MTGIILRTCIGCGCDDDNACIGGCHWAHEAETAPLGICSNCAQEIDPEELESSAMDWQRDYENAIDGEDDSLLLKPGDPEYEATIHGNNIND